MRKIRLKRLAKRLKNRPKAQQLKPPEKTIQKQKKSKSLKKRQEDQAKSVKHVRKLQLLEANESEDKEIKQLERVLKLKKRKNKKSDKISNVFVDDGLDYILNVVQKSKEEDASDSEDSISASSKPNKRPRKDLSDIISKKPRRLADLLGEDEKEEMIDNSDKDDNDDMSDEKESDEEMDEQSDNTNSSDDEKNEPLDLEEKKPEKPKIWEDIYGRLRDKEGNVLKNNEASIQTYIPPAKRLQSQNADDQKKFELLRITNKLKGLLNRLSESNMKPISSQIEEMYMKYSRNDMNETIVSLISDLVITPVSTAIRLVMEQAMLIALLHANIGSEVGAFVLQSLVTKLDKLLNLDENYGEGKLCNNLLLFLSHMYNFKVMHCSLIFDILKRLINSFQDKDIELIQLLLKNVGFALRKDDPVKLKEIVLLIQTKAPSFKSKEDSSRVQFMLDTLVAIRNNNIYKIPDYDPTIIEHMKKVLRNLIRSGSSVQELAISLEDLLKAEERGRWWIVGSAWSERDVPEQSSSTNVNAVTYSKANFSDKIIELARKQHMNTEIRKTIFCIIMTAEDYMDAFEKLLHLNLKKQQHSEIINVLLHCNLQEKIFNPYYTVLVGKFCKFDREYQWSLKRSIWDKIKELDNMKSFQRQNLARLLLHSFVNDDLPISVLKVIPFSEMNKVLEKFLRQIFLGLFLHESKDTCVKVFKRIAPAKKKFPLLREGLLWFMRIFLLQNPSAYKPDVYEKLKKHVLAAEHALDAGDSISLLCTKDS